MYRRDLRLRKKIGAPMVLAVTLLAVAPVFAQKSTTSKPVAVEVVKPTRRALTRELRLPATLVAEEQVDLFAKISGYVQTIDIDIGDRVEVGDVLVELFVPEMLNELHQAEAVLQANGARVQAAEAGVVRVLRSLDTARAQVSRFRAERVLQDLNLDRTRKLREGNAIPEQALDEARRAAAIAAAQLEVAEAQVAGAEAERLAAEADVQVSRSQVMVSQANVARLKTMMEYALIRAPFAGVITQRNVDHGTFVRSAAKGVTMSLLQVAKTDRVQVVLEIPEVDAPFVRKGTPASIDVKALGGDAFPSTVSRTAAAMKVDTRTMRAEIDIDNTDGKLAPGMYATVVVQLETQTNAMIVPSKAIHGRGKDTSVFVCTAGVVESKAVSIGYDDGIWAEILTGLDGDESIITASGGVLSTGAAVTPFTAGS
jgi:HlyD family secretion protein